MKHVTEIGIAFVVALSQINNKSSALAQSSSVAEDSLTILPRFGPQVQRRTQAKASKAIVATKAAKATVAPTVKGVTKATKAGKGTVATKAAKATVAPTVKGATKAGKAAAKSKQGGRI